MKNRIKTSLFVLLVVGLFACEKEGNLEVLKYPSFKVEYNEGFESGSSQAIQTKDGGYIVAGTIRLEESLPIDLLLVKYDINGEKEWEKIHGYEGANKAHKIVELPNGGYVLGGIKESVRDDHDIYLLRTDERGRRVWDRTIGDWGYDDLSDLLISNDNNIIVVGSTPRDFNGISDSYLAKFSLDGNLIWEVPQTQIRGLGSGTLTKTQDNAYVFLGVDYVLKVNDEGGIEWEREIKIERVRLRDICVDKDNNLLLSGNIRSSSGMENIFIVKIGSDGDVLLERELSHLDKNYTGSIISPSTDGNFIIYGAIGSSKGTFLRKIDKDGNTIWERCTEVGEGELVYPASISVTDDNGFIITGVNVAYDNGVTESSFYLIKTNSEGNIE